MRLGGSVSDAEQQIPRAAKIPPTKAASFGARDDSLQAFSRSNCSFEGLFPCCTPMKTGPEARLPNVSPVRKRWVRFARNLRAVGAGPNRAGRDLFLVIPRL